MELTGKWSYGLQCISSPKPSLIANCYVGVVHTSNVSNPPSQTASVILAAFSQTKQVTHFLSIIHVSNIIKILLNRFWVVCLSHIYDSANLLLRFSVCLRNHLFRKMLATEKLVLPIQYMHQQLETFILHNRKWLKVLCNHLPNHMCYGHGALTCPTIGI